MGCGPSSSAATQEPEADKRRREEALRETQAALAEARHTVAEQEKRLQQLEKEISDMRAEAHATDAILILGSTGHIGKATVKALAKRAPERRIFAGTRDTSRANDAGFAGLGDNVIPIRVDPGDKNQVAKTIVENFVSAVFIIVPGSEDRTKITISTIQGCRLANVAGFVVVSVPSVAEPETIFAKQFIPIEAAAQESGIPHAILRLPLFTDNFFAHMASIRGEGKIYGPAHPDTAFSTVVTSDVGEAAATLLCDIPSHNGAVYELASDTYSHNKLASAFSDALDKQVDYVQVSIDAARDSFLRMGFPGWQADGLLELYSLIDDKHPCMTLKTDELKELTGGRATSMPDFVKAVAPLFKSSREIIRHDSGSTNATAHSASDTNSSAGSSLHPDSPRTGPVLVLNGTSATGRATLKALAAEDHAALAAMRDPSQIGKKASDIDIEGISPIQVDLGDEGAVAKAVKEHSPLSIFIIAPPVEERGQICLAAIEGIKSVNFRGMVLVLSVINMNLPSTSTSLAADFTLVEMSLAQSGLKHCVLRLPFFYENLLNFADEVKSSSTLSAPVPGDVPFAGVGLSDVSAAAAKILTHSKDHIDKTYTLVSDVFAYDDVVKVLSETIEKKVVFNEITCLEARERLVACDQPEWFVNELLENYKILAERGSDQELLARKTETFEHITGRMPTPISAYIASVKEHF